MYKHVFLTGPPGIGKTTLIKKASEMLRSSGVSIDGFYTEEVRQGGRRIGFDIVTLSGKRGTLSRTQSDGRTDRREYRVGQYVVDLVSFEQLALPVLSSTVKENGKEKMICVVDEIGKMELFSESFIRTVRKTLDCAGALVFGTIPVPKAKPLPLVDEIRKRQDVKVFHITKENRDVILEEIVAAIYDCRK
ncbi:cancer-related nucleoside-triphosphatase [Spea bombifrons]|uniref:cancer-related nucleoside-triphosphatase n=1 Tax=Spea bombifrons TaxID=233779 RepID=UPI00234A8321|nr:cancer-related nucleoside-triphosphatase [Spea bombifrons]